MNLKKNKLSITTLVLLFMLFLGVFIYLSILVKNSGGDPILCDEVIIDYVYKIRGEESGLIYWIMLSLSEFGYYRVIIASFILIIVFTKFDSKALTFMIMLLIGYLVSTSLKVMYSRPRPDETLFWRVETSKSFPSGHSLLGTITWLSISYFVYDSNNKNIVKALTIIFTILVIPSIMVSRIFIGVHYFSDVIAGFLVGVMVFIASLIPYHIMKNHKILENGITFKKNNEKENSINI